MIKQYMVIAWRYLKHHRSYSLINAAGLTVGITVSLVLLLYVFEDAFYNKGVQTNGEVYQVLYQAGLNDQTYSFGQTSPGLSSYINHSEADIVRFSVNTFPESGAILTSTLPLQDFFKLTFTEGDPGGVWQNARQVIVTEEYARSRLIRKPYTGQAITINAESYTVAAVCHALPGNTIIHFDVLASPLSGLSDHSYYFTFLRMKEGGQAWRAVLSGSPDNSTTWMGKMGFTSSVYLVPFSQLYFEQGIIGNPQSIWGGLPIQVVVGLAFLVLLLVMGNYTAMATVQNYLRLRETGLRKILGASHPQVTGQFVAESFLLIMLAVFAGLILTEQLLPYFNSLTGKGLSLRGEWGAEEWLAILSVTVTVLIGTIIIPSIQLWGISAVQAVGRVNSKKLRYKGLRTVWAASQIGILWLLFFLALIANREQAKTDALSSLPATTGTVKYSEGLKVADALPVIQPSQTNHKSNDILKSEHIKYKKTQTFPPIPRTDISGILSSMTLAWAMICAWGLFGLVAFDRQKRTLAILFRQLVGATRRELVLHAGKRYIYMTSMAILLMLPLAYAAIQYWLMEVYFDTTASHRQPGVPWWIWTLTVGGCLLITVAISLFPFYPGVKNKLESLNK